MVVSDLSQMALTVFSVFHRVLQGAANGGGQFDFILRGSPDPFFACRKMSLFHLKTCTPMNLSVSRWAPFVALILRVFCLVRNPVEFDSVTEIEGQTQSSAQCRGLTWA